MKKILFILIMMLILVSCENFDTNKADTLENKNNLKSISIESGEFEKIKNGLKKVNNFSTFMIKEVEEYMENDELNIYKGDVDIELDNDYYRIEIDETIMILDEDTNLLRMSWIVSKNGKRGNGYKREPNMPKGMDRGHIKSVYEGAKDNSIEDSPLNIIPQSKKVNNPNIKEFESYRVKNCQGAKVITTIQSKKSVRVEIPTKNIDVTYNPYSKKEFGDGWWFKKNIK